MGFDRRGKEGERRRLNWVDTTAATMNTLCIVYRTSAECIFTSERHKREASQWVIFGLLPGSISYQEPLEALEAYITIGY